jgi:hypothetical protein
MVMVWNGKSSTKEAKKLALHTAQVLQGNILKSGSSFCMVLRLIENGETTLWKECFRDYPGELPISMQRQSLVSNISGRKDQKPIDIVKMHSEVRPDPARTFSTAGGRVQVWRVDDYHKTPLPEALYGHFWSNQSFLIRFTYKEGNSDRVMLYFWQGRGSSINEKGASAYLTKELGDENKEVESKHVRVPQGFEPTDFLEVFGNKFIVHLGPYKETWNTTDALFSVRGSTKVDSYPHEVAIVRTHAYFIETQSRLLKADSSIHRKRPLSTPTTLLFCTRQKERASFGLASRQMIQNHLGHRSLALLGPPQQSPREMKRTTSSLPLGENRAMSPTRLRDINPSCTPSPAFPEWSSATRSSKSAKMP